MICIHCLLNADYSIVYNNNTMYAKRHESQDIYDVLVFANQQILDYFHK